MHAQPRRKPLRMDAQDGPWSISVAENPSDTKSYSIYIQTPTHLLTLTRTASEIADLHARLVDLDPPQLPQLPLSEQPTKRRSSFLHTLSRLANNPSKSTAGSSSSRSSLTYPTPAVSPSKERDDPFANPLTAPSAAATSLAAYLTELANRSSVRTCRPWRRFVRVRTDDLESVRVERAIKRVRSDLAIHHPAPTPSTVLAPLLHSNNVSDVESTADDDLHEERESVVASLHDLHIQEEDEDEALASIREDAKIAELLSNEPVGLPMDPDTPPISTPSIPEPLSPVTPVESQPLFEPEPQHEEAAQPTSQPEEEPEPTLPTPAPSPTSPPTPPPHPAMRIPRSASADPDKASRLSRTWQDAAATTPPKSKGATPKPKRKVVIDDFEMMRVLGKGCAGKVLLVRHKASTNLYALKAITKRHVLAHQELQHTLTEQAVLKRMAHEAKDPFVVKLWWSFHDKENLFLVMDFHPGGDLATQLARWGRLGRDRARFYAAEIVEGVGGLHAAGVVYRDLKPENILIGADGHIVLTDFGLSKEFPRATTTSGGSTKDGAFYSNPATPGPAVPHWMSDGHGSPVSPGTSSAGGSPSRPGAPGWTGPRDVTSTFCGTAEYLAPEVIQGLPYSFEVDWWSFGTMLYEMLTGITPFWANNHSDMYVRVLQDELQFPDDKAMDQDTKSLIRGLLQRNPALRMTESRIKRHPYFSMIDWSHVYYKRYIPPYIPPIDPSNASDTQNFDETFLDMEPVIDNQDEGDEADESRGASPVQVHKEEGKEGEGEDEKDVFDGYSFKGRHSVIMDDEDADGLLKDDEDIDDIEVDAKVDDVVTKVEEGEGELTPPAVAEVEAPAQAPAVVAATEPEDASATPTQPSETSTPAPSTPAPAPSPTLPELPPPVPLKGALKPSPMEPSAGQTTTRPPSKAVTIAPQPSKRREKSGIPALDRLRGNGASTADEGSATEREEDDEEDDDWDLVETPGGEDRNGSKGTSLFARGVVDRYKLAIGIGRKGAGNGGQQRVVSSASSMGTGAGDDMPMGSPESGAEKRRGRLGRSTGRFLARARSPPAPARGVGSARSVSTATAGTTNSLVGSLSPSNTSSTLNTGSTVAPTSTPSSKTPQSLRSKESTTSMGSPSGSASSDGGSVSRERLAGAPVPLSATTNGNGSEKRGPEEKEGRKLKKMKKYKEGAEKVLSLFGSPRQERTQAAQS